MPGAGLIDSFVGIGFGSSQYELFTTHVQRYFPSMNIVDTAIGSFSKDGWNVLVFAYRTARKDSRGKFIISRDLLEGVLQTGRSVAANILQSKGIEKRKIGTFLFRDTIPAPRFFSTDSFSNDSIIALKNASQYANEHPHNGSRGVIYPDHLLLGLLDLPPSSSFRCKLERYKISPESIKRGIVFSED